MARATRRLNTVLRPLVVVTLVVGVLAGRMLVAHLGSNAFYLFRPRLRPRPEGIPHFLRQFLLNHARPGPSALRVLGCVASFALVVAHASARGKRGASAAGAARSVGVACRRHTALLARYFELPPTPAQPRAPRAFIALTTPTRAEGPFGPGA